MAGDPGFTDSLLPLFSVPEDGDEAVAQPLPGRLPSYIADHRARLRSRFMEAGAAALPDYELLELVLFRAIPRQDVKPLARLLLDTLKPVLSSWDALLDYCHTAMAHRETEQFRVLFLDRKNVLVADEEQAKGTVDHVPVYPREIVKRALELNASALILVHNHPSGDPTPSEADRTMTRQVQDACAALGLVLHDHLIIGKERELSFRARGYL